MALPAQQSQLESVRIDRFEVRQVDSIDAHEAVVISA
jgi:hypothetical protein